MNSSSESTKGQNFHTLMQRLYLTIQGSLPPPKILALNTSLCSHPSLLNSTFKRSPSLYLVLFFLLPTAVLLLAIWARQTSPLPSHQSLLLFSELAGLKPIKFLFIFLCAYRFFNLGSMARVNRGALWMLFSFPA